jgi:hypothetical protein
VALGKDSPPSAPSGPDATSSFADWSVERGDLFLPTGGRGGGGGRRRRRGWRLAVALLLLMVAGGTGGGVWCWWRRCWWWVVVVLVVLVTAAAATWWQRRWWPQSRRSGGGGPRLRSAGRRHGFWVFYCFQKYLPRAISALGTRALRGIHLALGIGLFAGPAVPSGLCREYSGLCRE